MRSLNKPDLAPGDYWRVWLFALWVIVTVALLCFARFQVVNLSRASDNRDRYLASVIAMEEASKALSDMEAGNRGFLLTGDMDTRASFYAGRDLFSARYKLLQASIGNDSLQRDRLYEIKKDLTEWFVLYNPLIQKRQKDGTNYRFAATDKAILSKCQELRAHISLLFQEMRTYEFMRLNGGESADPKNLGNI